MVIYQLAHHFAFLLLQGGVIRVSTQDVLELTLKLIDVIIVLTSEVKLHLLSGLCLVTLLFLEFLVKIFPQVLDDSIKMVTMLLPKRAHVILICFFDSQNSLSNLQAILFQASQDLCLFVKVLLPDCEVSFSFVKAHVGGINVVVLKKCFLNISEGHCLLFIN